MASLDDIMKEIDSAADVNGVSFGFLPPTEPWIKTVYPLTINGRECEVVLAHLRGGPLGHDWTLEVFDDETRAQIGQQVSGGSLEDVVHNFQWNQVNP